MLTSYYLSRWGTPFTPSGCSSCEICCEGFTPINRRPMVLVNCGHTLCEICLDSLVAHSLEDPSNNNDVYDPDTGMNKLSPDVTIRCPFCREKTEIAAVRPNYVLIQGNQHHQSRGSHMGYEGRIVRWSREWVDCINEYIPVKDLCCEFKRARIPTDNDSSSSNSTSRGG